MIETFCAEETFDVGERLGSQARAGEVYCLLGDLGVGKTVFTQALPEDSVSMNQSAALHLRLFRNTRGRLPFYHFDVYRIADPEEMDEIGFEDYLYGQGVCLIEWADLIRDLIPPFAKTVVIEKDLDKGFDYRRITVREGDFDA